MPRTTRRLFLQSTSLVGTYASFLSSLQAQTLTVDQAKIWVGFPPGGLADSVARRVAEGIRGTYARVVLVDNKPGVAAKLAVDETVKGPVDGSVMFLAPDVVITKAEHTDPKTTNFKFDDLVHVSGIGRLSHGFAVGPMVPETVRSMKDFIEWAKANPSKASFGTPGINSVQDFLMQIAMKSNNFVVNHVPYKGSAPGIQDLLGGQIAAMFSPVGDSIPYRTNGKMRLLGTSGEKRSKYAPEVPTFEEQGFKGMVQTDWFGIWMKKGTPAAVIANAHSAIKSAVNNPAMVEALDRFAIEADPAPPDVFSKLMREAHNKWGAWVKTTGYKPE